MEMKTITVHLDWLRHINGSTVQDAIKYLSTLPQEHELSVWMDGDTHGCEIIAQMHYKVPMTDEEIFAKHEKYYTREIAIYTKALEQHIAKGRYDREESCKRLLAQLNAKFDKIKVKYGKQ